jgi:hypothetical protein
MCVCVDEAGNDRRLIEVVNDCGGKPLGDGLTRVNGNYLFIFNRNRRVLDWKRRNGHDPTRSIDRRHDFSHPRSSKDVRSEVPSSLNLRTNR